MFHVWHQERFLVNFEYFVAAVELLARLMNRREDEYSDFEIIEKEDE